MSYSKIQLATQARNLREEAGLSQRQPIGDIRELVKDLGHELKEESFGDEFSATCFPIEIPRFAIVLNSDTMWNENFVRFTLAHELGHTYLNQHWAEMQRQGGPLKSKAEFQSNIPIEREADKFAVYFLTPSAFFLEQISNLEFDKNSLTEVCNNFGISLLTGAFRFIELTDLCCSLIVIDNLSQLVKYEFRSSLMREHNRHESISGWDIPYGGTVSKIVSSNNSFEQEDNIVDISEYYPNNRRGFTCKESVFKMNYNDTSVVMLSVQDDVESD